MAQGSVDALAYRSSILKYFEQLLRGSNIKNALDVGAGDGWFAQNLLKATLAGKIEAIDVLIRQHTWHPVKQYEGDVIPYDSSSFELVYAVDVLHHAPEPLKLLSEMMRCSSGWLLLKDHTYTSPMGWLTLSVLDELGNRKLGVPSIYKYQYRFSWVDFIESHGFKRIQLIHPAAVESRFWGKLTNRLQFIGLWCRS